MSNERNVLSGNTSMLILKLLQEKDMYGYEVIETLRERSQNVFAMKAGTLYPLLHSLEDQHLLTVYEKAVAGKLRKYYHITKEGNRELSRKQEEWGKYTKAISDVMDVQNAVLATEGM